MKVVSEPTASRRRTSLALLVALGFALMVLVTLINFYGISTTALSPHPDRESHAAALEQQQRNSEMLEEILTTLLSKKLVEETDDTAVATDVLDSRAAEKLLQRAEELVAKQQLRVDPEPQRESKKEPLEQLRPDAEAIANAEDIADADENTDADEIANAEAMKDAEALADAESITATGLFPADHDGSTMHIVYSTSCGQYNRVLQQTVLQQTATWVGQKGPITQILSGCSDEERAKVLLEPTFYYDFRRHFTPSYVPNPEPGVDDDYSPYNKPFGLRHFLENADPPVKHDILTLIDGDFFFFRPLEVNTGRDVSRHYAGSRDPATVDDSVVDGWAIAQDWTNVIRGGFYTAEKNQSLSAVCGGQPCGEVSLEDGVEYYANIGPPYIMTLHDAKRFVDDYCHLCVTARTVSSEWMTEMFAYSIAAANHGIKHTVLNHIGISAPRFAPDNHEYWDFVDGTMANPCEDNMVVVMPRDPPVAVHTCQVIHNYYKAVIPGEVANCDCPLLKNLPPTEWSELEQHVEEQYWVIRRQEVWVKCTLIKTMNRALTELKKRTCPNGFNTFRSAKAVS